MGDIVLITMKDASCGFRLAGVTHYSADGSEIGGVLTKALEDAPAGLVIVEESLMKYVPEDRIDSIEKNWQGILLTLPSPLRPGIEQEDIVGRLIQRAIGYHMRLKL